MPRFHRDEHAVVAGRDLAFVRAVFLEEMRHDAVAFGAVDEIGLEADQAARGDDGLHRDAVRLVLHVDDVGFARGEDLQDVAEVFVRNIDVERSRAVRADVPSSSRLEDDLGPRDEDLEAFAAHLLDENGDLHFAARLDFEMAGGVGVGDLEGDVGARLADEPLADLARGEQLAFAAGERAVVDANLHRDRRRIDLDEGQRQRALRCR